MSDLIIRPDDSGLQLLKSDNAAKTGTRAVTPADPYPAVQEGKRPEAPHSQPDDSKVKRERRRGERRKRQVPVLLDTRSKRDRRQQPETRVNDAGEEVATVTGIDVIA